MSIDPYEETWRRVHGGRIDLTIPELIPELKSLREEYPSSDPDFPFVLSAGQRRSSTANTIIRDPQWRPKDPAGALWMNPGDAFQLGVRSGGRVRVITKRASAETVVEVTETMLPGHVALPNGTGLWYPDREGQEFQTASHRMSSRQVSIAIGSRARRSTSTCPRGLNAWRNYDVITPGMRSASVRANREHPAIAGTSLFNFIAAPTLASWITKSLNAIEKCLRILGVCQSHAHRCEICPVELYNRVHNGLLQGVQRNRAQIDLAHQGRI